MLQPNELVKILPTDNPPLYKLDASFIVRAGLYNARDVSFESVNYPGYFINVDSNNLCHISQPDGTDAYNIAATWIPRKSLA
jgi:Alpha-L-arabinofuranosidase B (ABFB) domain